MKCLNHWSNKILEKTPQGMTESNNPPTLNVEFDELWKGAYDKATWTG